MAETDELTDEELEDDEIGDEEPAGPPSRRRGIVISGLVALVLLVGALLFFLRTKEEGLDPLAQELARRTDMIPGVKERVSRQKSRKKKIKYTRIFSQLDGKSTTEVLRELSISNIAFRTDQKGKNFDIFVDEEEVLEARNLLALKGLPSTGGRGYEIFDDAQNLGVTEFDKRIRFIRAISGELEQAILQFDYIEGCKVQIVLPEQRLFTVTQPPVTASILVRYAGQQMDDETIFGIIQLVANAVENLQPENVSVIDVRGRVLSTGIFERISAKRRRQGNGPIQVADPDLPDKEEEPDSEMLDQWFQVKRGLESDLEDKAYRQLRSILPKSAFKLAIAVDLERITGETPKVQRITTSIVVDSDKVPLDVLSKKRIFNTIAGAIGYVKGRDTIQLNKTQVSVNDDLGLVDEDIVDVPEVEPPIDKPDETKSETDNSWILWGGVALAIMGGVGGTIWWRRKTREDGQIGSFDEETERVSDFSELQDEMVDDRNLDQLRQLAQANPESLADIIKEWVGAEEPIQEAVTSEVAS